MGMYLAPGYEQLRSVRITKQTSENELGEVRETSSQRTAAQPIRAHLRRKALLSVIKVTYLPTILLPVNILNL